MTNQAAIRQATLVERNKKRAVGVRAGLTLALVALVSIWAAVALTPNVPVQAPPDNNPGTNKPDPEPSTPGETEIVFANPVSGSDWTILKESSLTELQFNATANRWEACKGYVIGATEGTAVVAPYAGTVKSVVSSALYGTQVTIEHAKGLKTVLSSLDSNVLVTAGQSVAKGQQIGSVSDSESVETFGQPHVRVELFENNKKINPADYINFGNK